MRVALFFCAAAVSLAQQPSDVLQRAQAQLAKSAADVSKYTCTQTVNRSYLREKRQPAQSCDAIVANREKGRSALSLEATDRLRFDVEVADGGYEIYAWPGAARIANEKVEDMAGGGPLGTGPFGPFLVDIFANPAVQFRYLGPKEGLFQYRYRVPLANSHYRVQTGAAYRITGYDGTFTLDPISARLKQLIVRTLELPHDTPACEATTTMDFAPLKIGAGEYLVPRATWLVVIGRDASVTENSTVYTECREFRGESALRFEDDVPQPPSPPKMQSAVSMSGLPAGLPVLLVLDTAIDTDLAAAGDPVVAKLVKPLIEPITKRVLAPAGSVVRGRITHLEHHIAGENYFLVGLNFESLETQTRTIPLSLILDNPGQKQDSRTLTDRPMSLTIESHSGFRGGGTLVFSTRQPRYLVPPGYASNWITLSE